MKKGRKTIEVHTLKEMVNDQLKSGKGTPETRQVLINLLDRVLHDTGNYKGYNGLDVNKVPVGELPGCRCEFLLHPDRHKIPEGSELTYYDMCFVDVDSTRVFYY